MTVQKLLLWITCAITWTPTEAQTRTPPQTPDSNKQIAFISLAPSPYSNRHDCMRAGFGIYLLLNDHIQRHQLPISTAYYDGVPMLPNKQRVTNALASADILIVGGATWGQGPTSHVRRFFELGGAVNLQGTASSAWATAGGAHTGGEEVVQSILRSMMGQGAKVFTLAQKYMVFTTDERIDPRQPGAFSQLDMWYMDRFARMIALQALSHDKETAHKLGKILNISPLYYLQTGSGSFPPSPEELTKFEPLRAKLNAAADPKSPQWRELRTLLSTPLPAQK